MPAPQIDLTLTGTDPKEATTDNLKSEIDAALAVNYDATAASAVWSATVSGTANAIVLTLPDCPLSDAEVVQNPTRIRFTPTADNTAATTITYGPFTSNLAPRSGGPSSGGELSAGSEVVIERQVAGSVWKIVEGATLLDDHTARTDNPHAVTKAQVGLGNADNTSDAAKPVSTAQQTALDAKLSTATARANYVITASVDAASTTSNIVLTGPEVPRYPSVGAVIVFEADRDFLRLDDDQSAYDGTVTAQTKDADGNLGGQYVVRPVSNGPAENGMIKNRQRYALEWLGGPGNSYRLSGYGDLAYGKATSTFLRATSVGGTADAIVVTTDFQHVDKSILAFYAASANTSNIPTLATLDQFGNQSAATQIRRSDGGTVTAGEWDTGDLVVVIYDGTGGNPWKLLAPVSKGQHATLDARVSTLETAGSGGVSDQYVAMVEDLIEEIEGPRLQSADYASSPRNPVNFSTWSEGVRSSVAPDTKTVLVFGCSTDDTDTPLHTDSMISQHLVQELNRRFGEPRNLAFDINDAAVDGAFLDTYATQINGVAGSDFLMAVGGQLVNSATLNAMVADNDFASYPTKLRAAIAAAKAKAKFVVWIDTLHPMIDYPQTMNATKSITYPSTGISYRLNNINHTFNVTNNTVQLVAISNYGRILQDGDTLRISGGANHPSFVDYTIAANGIDWTTGVVTLVEQLPGSGEYTEAVTVRHVNIPQDRLFVQQADMLVTADRTGDGETPMPGWITSDMCNTMLEDVCAEEGVHLWSLSRAQFRFMAMKRKENPALTNLQLYWQVFDHSVAKDGSAVQHNHPNEELFDFAGALFASEFCDHIAQGTLVNNRTI